MNEYVFLFPVAMYFDELPATYRLVKRSFGPERLFQIIDARYRQQGYGINWVFPSSCDLSDSDKWKVPEYADIRADDRILCGDIFADMFSNEMYIVSSHILNQLPPHSRLVVGGFYLGNFVNDLAKCSYERGIDTFVDEDTTESLFLMTDVPLIRTEWSLKALGLDDEFIEYRKEFRADKPWLTQA